MGEHTDEEIEDAIRTGLRAGVHTLRIAGDANRAMLRGFDDPMRRPVTTLDGPGFGLPDPEDEIAVGIDPGGDSPSVVVLRNGRVVR